MPWKTAEANKEVSSICPGLIESTYILLHEDTSQDVYDGTVDSNTNECPFNLLIEIVAILMNVPLIC